MGKTWEASGSLELDNNAVAASGALAYFFEGGTTTPLTVYEDASESTAHEHPLEADGNGRWPLVVVPFIATYDVKVTDANGTQLYYFRELPNPDPVDASSGIDTTKIAQTGDIKFSPKSGTVSGWVRCNGRTIGSATSGATERANSDTSDLYEFLWNNFADSILAVSGGRGGTAAADFAANKPMALFDLRAGGLFGLDDMGNSAASRLGSAPFTTGAATTAGSYLGENTHALVTGELASHSHAVSITSGVQSANHTHTGTTSSDGSHTHTLNNATNMVNNTAGGLTISAGNPYGIKDLTSEIASNGAHTHTMTTGNQSADHTHAVSGTSATAGSGTAHNVVSLGILGNWLIRL